MRFATDRFGEIEVSDQELFEFPSGLPGFARLKSYAIIQHREDSPFRWLQSVEDPGVAFVVLDPSLIIDAYKPTLRPSDLDMVGAQEGDVLLFVADKAKTANTCMGAIRLEIGRRLEMIREGEWRFMWLTDPPLFEEADDGSWASSHHPFTCPRPEDEQYLLTEPGRVLARAYDIVLNGVELGGGSIRIHRPIAVGNHKILVNHRPNVLDR